MTPEGLADLDPLFAECLAVGGPVLREFVREPGFAGLVRIIIEQQLSTRGAETLWRKLLTFVDPLTPDGLLCLDDDALRACGLSRQKIGYTRDIARRVADGSFDFAAVRAADDETAIALLRGLKGIGRWTAEIYLMAAEGRPDLWPVDDLAIRLGVQRLKGWEAAPERARLLAVAEPWRPHRTLAARLVWHHYVALQERQRRSRAA